METSTNGDLNLSRRNLLVVGAGVAGAVGLGLATAGPAMATEQSDWRWCNRCQCLFYSGNWTTGWCTQGGGHDYEGSGNYTPTYGSGSGQHYWRWCHKCQSMCYGGGNGHGRCPAHGGHDWSGSGDYYIEWGNPQHGEQEGWRYCRKCYCLCYADFNSGHCPSGGSHNWNGSYNYYLAHQ